MGKAVLKRNVVEMEELSCVDLWCEIEVIVRGSMAAVRGRRYLGNSKLHCEIAELRCVLLERRGLRCEESAVLGRKIMV